MDKNELKAKVEKNLSKMSSEYIENCSEKWKQHNKKIYIFLLGMIVLLFIMSIVLLFIMSIAYGLFIILLDVVYVACVLYGIFRDKKMSDKENAIEYICYMYKKDSTLLEEDFYKSIKNTNIKTITISATLTKDNKIHFDEQEQKIIFEMINMPKAEYSYFSILRYEVVENGTSVVKGTAGKALVGGLLFGLEGAIVGSSGSKKLQDKCKELKVIIYLNDFQTPSIIVPFINYETDKDSIVYTSSIKQVRELCALLEYAINNKTLEESSKKEGKVKETEKSIKEQLQELKEMLEEGLITQKDFNEKKKKLLDL